METETKETETGKKEAQEQWDKERQRADQAEAMASKAREEAQSYAEELEDAKADLQEMKSQLEASKKEIQEEKDTLSKMDTALVDPAVADNIAKLEQRDRAKAEKMEQLEKKIAELEAEKTERARQTLISQAREEILSDCDNEFSPKFRTKALELADKLVDSGEEKQPQDKYSGYKLMKKCYRQVADEEKAKETETVSVDSGKSGVSHTTKKRKSGTMKEVLADMKKDKSWMNPG